LQIDPSKEDNKYMLKKTAQSVFFLFVLGALVLTNVLFVADCVKGFHSLIDKIGIDTIIFAILLITTIVILRMWKRAIIKPVFFYTYIYILIPVATILAIVLTYIELTHYYNYLYSHFFVYFDRVTLWAISTWIFGLVLMPEKYLKKYWRSIIFGFPVGIFFAFALVWTWPQDIFLQLVKEDNLVENAQVLTLLTGFMAALFLSKNFLEKKLLILGGLFLIVATVLFFIAGDEMSWGQRLLQLETPSELTKKNLQDEITVHNINGLHQLIGYGYILIGLYGSFAWIVGDNFLKKYHKWTVYFIPPAYIFLFFYLSLIYNSYALGGVNLFKEWSEVAELLLYSGITIFLSVNYLKVIFKKL
jgi:hypothetical protein